MNVCGCVNCVDVYVCQCVCVCVCYASCYMHSICVYAHVCAHMCIHACTFMLGGKVLCVCACVLGGGVEFYLECLP